MIKRFSYRSFKIIILLLVITNTQTISFSNSTEDSLLLIAKTQKDSLAASAFLQLGEIYHIKNQEQALDYYRSACRIARQKGIRSTELKSKFNIAKLFKDHGHYRLALDEFSSCIQMCTYLNDTLSFADCRFYKGIVFAKLGHYDNALKEYFGALIVYENIDNQGRIAMIYNSIGLVFKNQGDNERALEYFRKSLRMNQQLNQSIGIANSLTSIGIVYKNLNRTEDAIINYEKALKIYEEAKELNMIAGTYNNIGVAWLKTGAPDSARFWFERSYTLHLDNNNLIEAASVSQNIGEAFIDSKKPREAIKWLLSSMEVVKSVNQLPYIQTGYHELHRAYILLGKMDTALFYYKKYIEVKDSIFDIERIKNVAQSELQYQFEKERQIESFNSFQESKKNEIELAGERQIRNLSVAFIGILIALAAILLRSLRIRKKMYLRLEEKQEIIKSKNMAQKDLINETNVLLKEKEFLLREIHHRVMNNLQTIKSMLNLQISSLDDETEVLALQDAQNRVQAMSLVHNKLYTGDQSYLVNFEQFAMELFSSVKEAYAHPECTVSCVINGSDLQVNSETILPLGLILNELLTNTFKHAFVHRSEGKIWIDLVRLKESIYRMEVLDDGVGINHSLDPDHSKSMGMGLIDSLSDQLNGFFYYKGGEKGSTFTVEFYELEES
jgi:two-component system, sensor histidine kinase PdtaS